MAAAKVSWASPRAAVHHATLSLYLKVPALLLLFRITQVSAYYTGLRKINVTSSIVILLLLTRRWHRSDTFACHVWLSTLLHTLTVLLHMYSMALLAAAHGAQTLSIWNNFISSICWNSFENKICFSSDWTCDGISIIHDGHFLVMYSKSNSKFLIVAGFNFAGCKCCN